MKIFDNKMRKVSVKFYLFFVFTVLLNSACKKWYGIPEDKDFLSERIAIKTKAYTPVLGRTAVFPASVDADGSTIPLSFEIVNVRNASDSSATEDLTKTYPTLVWTDDYTGKEKSIEEIEAKRKLENHKAFEVRRSGEFYLWASATNSVLPNYQGASVPKSAGYLFDVKVSNSGGERILKDFTLRPLRERPYEPSGRDAVTGIQNAPINPTISGMVGVNSRIELKNDQADTTKRDVRVLFRKTGNGSSLTFKFLDKNFKTIDPHLFNLTRWDNLVHGFNKSETNQYIRYDVAYPIPLTSRPTSYTTASGSQAAVYFAYSRLGFNGVRVVGSINFAFNIYEKGDWEIAFQFRYDNPKFADE